MNVALDRPIEGFRFDLIHFCQMTIKKHMNAAKCENPGFDALCLCFCSEGFIAHKF